MVHKGRLVKKINLIAIVGTDRSGSTLLDKIISANPQCVSLGEAHWFHLYFTYNHLCTCGRPVNECAFWTKILERLRGTAFQRESVSILGWRKRASIILRKTFLGNRGIDKDYQDYSRAYALLCQAALELCDKQYIVDSCKDATRLYLLHRSGMFNITPVYICRSVEDYVVSEINHPLKYYTNRRMGTRKRILRWAFRNAETRYLLPNIDPDYIQVSYMRLVSDPDGVMEAVSRKLNDHFKYDPKKIQEVEYHFLGGNHMKYRKFEGIVPDRKDVSKAFNSSAVKTLLMRLNLVFVRDRL